MTGRKLPGASLRQSKNLTFPIAISIKNPFPVTYVAIHFVLQPLFSIFSRQTLPCDKIVIP